MKEAMSSHNLRGLSLVADLCILQGFLIMIGLGVLLLVLGSIFVFIPIGAGAFMIAMGYYLDDLRQFAWWAVIIINSLTLAGIFIGTISTYIIFHFPIGLTDFATFIISVPLGLLIIGYLLRSSVRALFFEGSSSPEA